MPNLAANRQKSVRKFSSSTKESKNTNNENNSFSKRKKNIDITPLRIQSEKVSKDELIRHQKRNRIDISTLSPLALSPKDNFSDINSSHIDMEVTKNALMEALGLNDNQNIIGDDDIYSAKNDVIDINSYIKEELIKEQKITPPKEKRNVYRSSTNRRRPKTDSNKRESQETFESIKYNEDVSNNKRDKKEDFNYLTPKEENSNLQTRKRKSIKEIIQSNVKPPISDEKRNDFISIKKNEMESKYKTKKTSEENYFDQQNEKKKDDDNKLNDNQTKSSLKEEKDSTKKKELIDNTQKIKKEEKQQKLSFEKKKIETSEIPSKSPKEDEKIDYLKYKLSNSDSLFGKASQNEVLKQTQRKNEKLYSKQNQTKKIKTKQNIKQKDDDKRKIYSSFVSLFENRENEFLSNLQSQHSQICSVFLSIEHKLKSIQSK